jgi:hypothetical protein
LGRYENVAEFLHYERGANRFTVVVAGRSIIVQPIQPVRPDMPAI